MMLSAQLTLTDFVPHLRTFFDALLPSPAPDGATHVPLELVEATPLLAATTPDGARRGFSLLFLGPVSAYYLNQGTHTLRHAVLGDLDIFMTPLGPSTDAAHGHNRMCYQAIFN